MMGDRMPREAPSPPPGAAPGGIKGDDGPRKDGEPIVHRKRGPALPAAPAKSLPLATKNFYKGIRSVAQEAANITGRANLKTDSREGSPACAVGVLVMAVAHGLTDHKNGRISKEDERVAATRKPQAFILSTGQIPPSSMQKIFSCALQGQGALREGSPPAEITSWHGHHQAEQWYASRKSEMLASWKALDKFQTAEKPGEGGEGCRSVVGESSAEQPAAPKQFHKHPIMTGLITPEQDMRTKTAAADIGKWLREECGAGLDDFDQNRVLCCLTNPDRGVPDKETLFSLPEEELCSILAPIREHGLKNFMLQMCRRARHPRPAAHELQAAKMRKTNNGNGGMG